MAIDLYWLPLGAGGRSVRINGRVYEALASRLGGRAPRDLYHSALVVSVPEGKYVIEVTPVPRGDSGSRGVVAGGSVGAAAAGRLRLFRYEIRRWRGGVIPDIAEAVASPRRVSDDPATSRRLLRLVPEVPCPVWGRDELGLGEMWNSNSVVSWLLVCAGVDVDAVCPPLGGRAPGWHAGVAAASLEAAA